MKLEASTFVYASWVEALVTDVNLRTDSFRMLLVTRDYIPQTSSHSLLKDISHEVKGLGYQRQVLQNVKLKRTEENGISTINMIADNVTYVADGSDWTAHRYVIYDETAPDSPLFCYGLLDARGKDVFVTDGNSLTVQFDPKGLFGVSIG